MLTGIIVEEMMGGECKNVGGEKWCHLPHVHHSADVPHTNVLVKDRRPPEHLPVRRHAADEGREEGHSVRSRYTAVVLGSGSKWVWW